MQAPIFEHYGVDQVKFWDEVNQLGELYRDDLDPFALNGASWYLNHFLTYVRDGVFHDLSNEKLRSFGALQRLAPGVPDVFNFINEHAAKQAKSCTIEHYLLTTGLRQVAMGSAVAPYMRQVWGSEFVSQMSYHELETEGPEQLRDKLVTDIAVVFDDTAKTRAVFEISKGVREGCASSVNDFIPVKYRRIPIERMIYVADGPSDIPVWSVVKSHGGKCLAVHQPESASGLEDAKLLQRQGRVDAVAAADFQPGSDALKWITACIDTIVDKGEELSNAEHGAVYKSSPPPQHRYK